MSIVGYNSYIIDYNCARFFVLAFSVSDLALGVKIKTFISMARNWTLN